MVGWQVKQKDGEGGDGGVVLGEDVGRGGKMKGKQGKMDMWWPPGGLRVGPELTRGTNLSKPQGKHFIRVCVGGGFGRVWACEGVRLRVAGSVVFLTVAMGFTLIAPVYVLLHYLLVELTLHLQQFENTLHCMPYIAWHKVVLISD